MRYISGLHEGETIRNIYLCKGKRSAETRNGKPYDNVLLQDKTGTLDGKVWDPNSQGIADYDEKDFIEVYGEVINYNGNLQINIKQIRKAGEEEYNPADYMPTTEKSVDGMYEQLTEFIRHISNPYLKSLLEYFFVNDQEFIKKIPVTFCSENGTPRIFGRTAGTYVERTSDVRIFCRIIWNFKQRSSVDSGNVP